MKDNERRLILECLSELYAPGDLAVMVQRMPIEDEDPEGTNFDEYVGMIQTVFSFGFNPDEDAPELQARMRLIARKYGYPRKIFLGVENDTTVS
jgi:hypothetical protein